MACKADIRKAILDRAFSELTDRRYTFSRVGDDTIQVNGRVDDRHTRAQSRAQARAIANELLGRTKKSFNGHITGYVTELSEFDPITVTFTPSDAYVNHEFSLLPKEKVSDGINMEGQERSRTLSDRASNTEALEPGDATEPSRGVYAKYVDFKRTQISEYHRRLQRVQSLKREKNLEEKDLARLNKMENEYKRIMYGNEELGVTGLKQEIAELTNEANAQVNAVAYYIEKDLERLKQLANSENLDDLREAQRLIDFYAEAGTFREGVENPFFTDEDIFIPKEDGTLSAEYALPESVMAQYRDWASRAGEYQPRIDKKQEEITVETINNNPMVKATYGKDKDFAFKELTYKDTGLRDTDWISMWLLDVTHGLSSTNGLIPQVMFGILNNTIEQKEAWARKLAADVDEMTPRVQKALTRVGKTLEALGITGIKGNSYNLFKQISKEGNETNNLVQRFTKEFSDAQDKALNIFQREFDIARTIDDYGQRQRAFNTAFERLKKWRRDNTIIIDGSRLTDTAYKQEIVDAVGERGYNDAVAQQKELIKRYKADKQSVIETALIQENKATYADLSDKTKNNIKLWEKKNDPKEGYEDYNSVTGVFFDNKKENNYMSYNVFIPRRYKPNIKSNIDTNIYEISNSNVETGHFDKSYEVIESDPDLLAFYDKVKEFAEIVHQNLPYELQEKTAVYTLPGLMKTSAELINDTNTTTLRRLFAPFRHMYDRFRTSFGVVKQSDITYAAKDPISGKVPYKVNDNFLRNNSKAIRERELIEQTKFLRAFNPSQKKPQQIKDIKHFSVLDISRFDTDALVLLAQYLHVNISLADIKARNIGAITARTGKNVEIGRLIADFSLHSVVQSQSFDLPKLMKYFSDMTMAYAARQEALPILEIMKKHYDSIKNPATTNTLRRIYNRLTGKNEMEVGVRTGAYRQMDNQFNRVALDNYGLKSAGEFGKIGKAGEIPLIGRSIYTKEERQKFEEIEKLIANETDDAKKAKLRIIQEGLGKTRTTTALIDNLLNWIRTLRLGYNVASSITNFLEGITSNMSLGASNEHFEPKELLYGYNIVKEAWLKNATFGFAATPRATKVRSLVDKFNVIIDSKNELQRASRRGFASRISSILSPYEMNSRVEYLNQFPLMVAILRTMKVKDKSGNEATVWDAYDKYGKLKPDFQTEENKLNWEELGGEQYQIFKTKLQEVIGLGHGYGYDAMKGMMAKSNTAGKTVMMFKTWIPSALFWRFASKQDNIAMGKQGFKGRYLSYGAGGGFVHGAAVGAVLFGPFGALAAGLVGGIAAGIGGTNKDFGMIGIIKETLLTTKQLFLKSIGMPINLLAGRQIIGDNLLGKSAFERWVGKGNFTKQDEHNMKANMADLALQLAWLGFLLMAKSLLWDDDDEKDSDRRQWHNVLVNKLMQLSSNATMFVNPVDMYDGTVGTISIVQYSKDVGKELVRVQKYLDGDDIIKTGVNAGRSGLGIQSRKTFLPGIFKDTQFGFEAQRQKVYPEESPWHRYFKSQQTIEKDQSKGERAAMRKDLMESEEWKKEYPIYDERKKAVEKEINLLLPTPAQLRRRGEIE